MTGSNPRVWMSLFVALVFVCGVSLGLAVGVWLAPRDRVDRPVGPRPTAGPATGPRALIAERILDPLEDDPGFTPEQRERLAALLTERQERFRRFNRDMRRRFEAEQATLREDIAAILTPEQMELLDRGQGRARRWRDLGQPRERRGR